MRFVLLAIIWITGLLNAIPCGAAPQHISSPADQIAVELRALVEEQLSGQKLVLNRQLLLDDTTLPQFYSGFNYQPAWIATDGLNVSGRLLLDTLRDAELEGLCPEEYRLATLELLVRFEHDLRRGGVATDPHFLASLDILLTDAFLSFVGDLVEGRVNPADVYPDWDVPQQKADTAWLLAQMISAERAAQVLRQLIPASVDYRGLRRYLRYYRELSVRGDWPQIEEGPLLKPGESDRRVPKLRARLLFSGDLEFDNTRPDEYYDDATVAALKKFQRRHGLFPDGVLGDQTRKELNVPLRRRIDQLMLNMERWRWLARDLGERYLLVNIADFSLSVIDGGEYVMSMPVVVGTAYRRTPVFSAKLKYVVLNPYWYVPETIFREDKLPLLRVDHDYLVQHDYDLVEWQGGRIVKIDAEQIDWRDVDPEQFKGILRKRPGEGNPLGKIKFLFPNPYDIYLHDTSQKYLFRKQTRLFSSGCIRIERPLDLAQYLLQREGWSRERLLMILTQPEEYQIKLTSSWPVHLVYQTAWVDKAGLVHFRPDVYWQDWDLERALQKRRAKAVRTDP
ncbi:MAG: L,D-transpeptidase family protein [Desulfuromonadales bacterium]|nr:L,D-transpeptidase family protein [Desulfuromonadales bacterium]